MKENLFSISIGCFVTGLVMRFNAKGLSWESQGSFSRLNEAKVVFFDQTGLILTVFGLLLCLLVIHHWLLRDKS